MTDAGVFFVFLITLSLVTLAIIRKWRLLDLAARTSPVASKLALMTPLIGFVLFLGACTFVPLWTLSLIQYTDTHGYSSFSRIESESVAQLGALLVSFILLMGLSSLHPVDVKTRIWGQMSALKACALGLLFCALTYPIVMTIVQGIHLGLDFLGLKPVQEQIALAQLKAIQAYPVLFWTFAFFIVTLVPIIEEFLFRGLLQNYFSNFLSPKFAIAFTSLLFALFHYSTAQGATNIELMIGLFFYSFFLGIFYMREGSLWTPIAMHATFNALTIFIMFYLLA